VFLGTIADAAKDSSLSRIAENTGLGREDSLYKTLKVCECPCFETLKSLGVKLGVSAITILWVFFFFGIMIPVIVNAKETKILYDNYSIPSTLMGGKQVSKSYYIKESVKKLDKNNPNILEVKVYRTVISRIGKTEYYVTFHINSSMRQYKIVRHWSTGFGEDTGDMVNGTWRDINDSEDMPVLMRLITPNK